MVWIWVSRFICLFVGLFFGLSVGYEAGKNSNIPENPDSCTYTLAEKQPPYPKTSWVCDCGFQFALVQGYDPDWKSSNYGKLILPTGKCMKCKREIKAIEQQTKEEE